MTKKRPIVLSILDGWGISSNEHGNATSDKLMPKIAKIKENFPWVRAEASGEWVGLPKGQMGNSEVGHTHLGAGRIKFESLSLINNAINAGDFNNNVEINKAINNSLQTKTPLHILGLFSNGGVHSHIEHIFAIYKLAIEKGLKDIRIHAFGDGRDTKPELIKEFIHKFYDLKKKYKYGEIASISGRYYAMDRDKRFDRIQAAYDVIVKRIGSSFSDALDYIDQEYASGRNDEFLKPAFNNNLNKGINSGESVIFANFRPDRAIQLASVLTNKDYIWTPEEFVEDIYFVSMMKYSDSVISNRIAFQPVEVKNGLGEWLSKKGYNQLRIAETEKIAHVTFFFDAGKDYFENGLAKPEEIKLPHARSLLISSPKVATYDLKPEMSCYEITNSLIAELDKDYYDVVILNFANCDMVGHTGVLEAAIKATKSVDDCVDMIHQKVLEKNGVMIITADHGNAEVMIDLDGGPNKKHTSMQVPIIITDKKLKLKDSNVGIANVAPTILDLLNEEIPPEMTEESLIIK